MTDTPTPVPAASERMTADDICYTCGDPRATHNNRTDTCTREGCRCSSFVDRPQPDRAKADEPTLAAIRRRANNYSPSHGIIPTMSDVIDLLSLYDTLSARAEAAEARAETARREALEEAAKLAETPSGINRGRENARGKAIAKYIRALLTAPPPTAKEG